MKPCTLCALLFLAPLAACGPKTATTPPAPAAAPVEEAPAPVAAIPEGWFALTPQMFVTDVDAAVTFYGAALGAQPVMSMPGPDGQTMHAEIKIGDSLVMVERASDEMKTPKTLGGSAANLFVYVPDVDAAFATATAAGATVVAPVADQFWGDRTGTVTDPDGHLWTLGTHTEDLTPEQIQQRAELLPPPTKAKAKKSKSHKPVEPKWKTIVGTPATQPVPADYHTVTLDLTVDDAAAALTWYQTAFGATVVDQMPMGDKLMHATIAIGDSRLMIADEFPQFGTKSPKSLGGMSTMVHHYVQDVDGVFTAATGAGGASVMPVADMPWGDRYGAVVGPDGYGWGVATHKEDLTAEQITQRMSEAPPTEEPAGDAPAAAGPVPATKPAAAAPAAGSAQKALPAKPGA
jgi:PhnB protein